MIYPIRVCTKSVIYHNCCRRYFRYGGWARKLLIFFQPHIKYIWIVTPGSGVRVSTPPPFVSTLYIPSWEVSTSHVLKCWTYIQISGQCRHVTKNWSYHLKSDFFSFRMVSFIIWSCLPCQQIPFNIKLTTGGGDSLQTPAWLFIYILMFIYIVII